VDRSRHIYSALDELRQIQTEARRSNSVEELKEYFQRIQVIRRTHIDDFETQLAVADAQEEVVERAHALSGRARRAEALLREQPKPEAAEIPADVPRIDTKNWQRVIYLALFFTVLICAAFFYLIQTARRINFEPATPAATQQPAAPAEKSTTTKTVSATAAAALGKPTVRLYTDLIPGTVSVDGAAPQDLKDGELILDNLQPGRHSMQVTGRNGSAGFSFDVDEKTAPRILGVPAASNAMTVLVSEQDGKGRLVTNADNSEVALDGKTAGNAGSDGLLLENLGTADHELQVTQGKDRQRFVLTYTPAPVLTVYVKSDPNAGTVVVVTGVDGADVFINNLPYRRKTDRGQVRIPLKVGHYTIRVHKAGFLDPPPETVDVKKAEETALQFRLEPIPETATLQVKNALPGTMVYVDKDLGAVIGADGAANISTVKPGDHTIELRRDQALPKKFQRNFQTGQVVVLSGPDATLEKTITESQAVPPPQPAPATQPAALDNQGMEMEGEQVRKGGGFVPYHVPKVAGHYSFQAQGRIGGFLKHSKLQWYAGYLDPENYVLFTVDGKHATIRRIHDGKAEQVSKIPFDIDSNQWVQVYLSVEPDSIKAQIKTPESPWHDLGSVTSESGQKFTEGKVGFYIPGNDEIAVSNFRFSSH